jgi:hypothetical protein
MPATKFPNGIVAPLLQADGTQVTAITSLTDNSGGTGSDTIAAIGGTYNQAEVRNAIASLADKLNEVIAAQQAAGVTGS